MYWMLQSWVEPILSRVAFAIKGPLGGLIPQEHYCSRAVFEPAHYERCLALQSHALPDAGMKED